MGEGDDNSPIDWLPAGWRTEVKIRKSGKKDRYYIDPSNELRFASKPKVIRYLKTAEKNHPPCEESQKGSSTDSSGFVDKEAVSEDLPAGWIKKFRVTRSGNQKDPYYIDTVSGHQFRSVKEVFLYLDSRKTDIKNNGRHASKPEEKTPLKREAADHTVHASSFTPFRKYFTPGEEAGPSRRAIDLNVTPSPESVPPAPLSAVSTAERRQLRSDSNRKVQKLIPENQNPEVEALAINNLGLTKQNKLKPCKEKAISSEICSPVLPDLAEKIKTKKCVDAQEDMPVEEMQIDKVELQDGLLPEKIQTDERVDAQDDILPPEKIQIDKRVEAQEDTLSEEILTSGMKINKRTKRESELPRRTSKRLAGVEVQLPVVLELPTRARHAAFRPTSEDQSRCSINSKGSDNSVKQVKRVKSGDEACKLEDINKLTPPEDGLPEVKEHASLAVVDALPEEQQVVASVLLEKHPEQRLAESLLEQHSDQGVVDVLLKEQAEQGVTDVLPKEQAEQGVAYVLPKEQAEQGVADVLFKEQAERQVANVLPEFTKCEGHEETEMALDSSLGGLWNDPCIEFAIKTLTGDFPVGIDKKVANKNSEPSVEVLDAAGPSSCKDLSLGDLWSDPCFEFAVKTLTGDIPPSIDATRLSTGFQQQHWSSKTGESNGIRLPNYKAAEFNQANGAYR